MKIWAVVAGIACVVACARDASLQWSPPAILSQATGGGAAPVFAAGTSGRSALAWVSAPHAGNDGRLFVRPDAGTGAETGSIAELRDPLGSLSIYGEVPPKIAYAPDGTLYAAYLVTRIVPGMRWPQNALRFAVSSDGGAHWAAPTTVTGDSVFGSYDDHALHVAPDGLIYLSWLAESKMDTSHTYFARSADRGKTWSRPRIIDQDRSCPCCRTAMTSGPDGALYVAWRKRFPGDERDVVVAKSSDQGMTWTVPVRVHTDAWQVNYCPDAGPSIKVGRDRTVHVAWWTGREGRAGTQYAQSRDGGATFSRPVELGLAQHSRAAHIQLALGEGADSALVVTAWDDGTRQVPQIVVRMSRDGGRRFGPVEAVSAPESEAGYPVLLLKPGVVIVAWQERSLAAAAEDAAARAKMDKMDPRTYVNAVGAMQVVWRNGALLAGAGGDAREASFRPLTVGEAVHAYAVPTLAGDTVRVGGAGNVTVVNVWATWCTSCREEMADLNTLHEEFVSRGVRVVGVSVDADDGSRVRRFAEEEKLTFTVAHDPDRRVERVFQVVGVPETFVIGKDGRLVWRHIGSLHSVVDSARAAIGGAIGGS